MKSKPKYFIRDLLVCIGVAVVLVISFAVALEGDWKDTSERYIRSATQRAGDDFQQMVAQVEGSLEMVRAWGLAGKLDAARPEEAKPLLLAFFGKKAKLSGISVAGTKEPGFFLLPDGTVRLPGREKLYQPADRPWFAPALEQEGCSWTGIYRFFTLREQGLTASISWTNRNGSQTVAAFDVLLGDFYESVQRLAPTPGARAFIFLPEGQLYLPGAESPGTGPQEELLEHALDRWKENAAKHDAAESTVFKLRVGGMAYWCGFVPLEKARQNVWMGVVVPEADIVGDMARRRRVYIGIGTAVFLAIAGLYFWLRKRARTVRPSAAAADAELVRKTIAAGESRTVEFKSTLRMNLHAGKPGKEIELAWLKGVAGFLNTDGGTLLLGVTDDGEITGIEADLFENDDKCRLHFKNLVANHLGADISQHIRFSLVPMAGKTVGVVQCSPASRPVYLRNGNKEAFYIRNGPSSDELPVSKAISYIGDRWK